MDFSKLAPADKQEVSIYLPYYNSSNERQVLPFALSLYRQGAIEGQRKVQNLKGKPEQHVPFVATWFVSRLPADLTRCTVKFEDNEDFSYEMRLPNHEFIAFLIQLMINAKRSKITDFPTNFYKKLLQYED